MRFARILFWEGLQNLPLVAGLVVALALWQEKRWGAAVLGTALASLLGSLVIRFTESKIVEGHQEPTRVVVANTITITGLTLVSVAYLSAGWSDWKTDLPVGTLAGITLAGVQDLAAGESFGVRHALALACSLPLALMGIRAIVTTLPILGSIFVITAIVTLIISSIDYSD